MPGDTRVREMTAVIRRASIRHPAESPTLCAWVFTAAVSGCRVSRDAGEWLLAPGNIRPSRGTRSSAFHAQSSQSGMGPCHRAPSRALVCQSEPMRGKLSVQRSTDWDVQWKRTHVSKLSANEVLDFE